MSDIEAADCRAQGALDNFLREMQWRLDKEGRSLKYKAQFWRSLNMELRHKLMEAQ